MSVSGQNGQGEDDNAPDEVVAPVRDIYKQKPASKVVRVLTVLAYLLSVSLAAILLSIYYVCVWKSPELPPLNNTIDNNATIHNASEYFEIDPKFSFTGGINTTIDGVVTQPSQSDSTPELTNAEGVEIFGSNSTLISNILLPDYKHSDSNKTLNNIGISNATDSIT